MSAITTDVGDKVKDTLKPAVKEVKSLKNEIKKKKSITFKRIKVFAWIKQKLWRKEE